MVGERTRVTHMMNNISDRDHEAEELFREVMSGMPLSKVNVSSKGVNEGLRDKFIRLEKLKKSEQSKWRDAATLRQYIKLNRVPRGLRSQIFPTYDDLDDDLLSKWDSELNQSSLNLMDILITNANRKIKALQEQILKLEE